MSTRRKTSRKLPEARGNAPKASHYRVVVVGDPPNDLPDKVSALHAGAVKHQPREYHRPSKSQRDTRKAQP